MTAKTFDATGLTFAPLSRPDRPAFVVDAPAVAAPAREADMAPFAANTAIYDKIHRREKRPIAMLVGGAAIILTVGVLFATSGHKRSTIGETPATPPAAAEPEMQAPAEPAPVAATAMTPASPAAAAPAQRATPTAERAAPKKVARTERTTTPARPVTPVETPAPTPTVISPAPVAVAPTPTVVAPPPVVVAPTPVETPSDTPR